MKKQNIEVEGGEILLQSKEGHYAIIPAKHRQEVMDMVKDGCDDCINNYIQTLPKDSDYAEDGSLIPEDKKKEAPIFQGGTLPVTDITAKPIGKGKYLAEFDKRYPRQEYKETNEYIRRFQPEKVVQKQAWRDAERNRRRDNYAKSYMIRDKDLKMQQEYEKNKQNLPWWKKRVEGVNTTPQQKEQILEQQAKDRLEWSNKPLEHKAGWIASEIAMALVPELFFLKGTSKGAQIAKKLSKKSSYTPYSSVINKTDDVVKAGNKVLNKTDDVKVFNSILDNPKEIEAITNNIKDISKDDIIKLEGYLKDTYDYENLTPWQKNKLLDRESYYLKKNNISVSDRIENDKKLLKFWEDYKKERKTYFESPKFRERLEKQVGKMDDEKFAKYKSDLLSNLERRPYIRPDIVADYSAAHYKPKDHIGISGHTPGHSYFTDKTVTKRTVEHEGRHQLTNADDAIYGFPSQQELEANLVHPDLLNLEPDFIKNVGNKTGREYFLSPEEFIVRLDELKRDLSKVGYDYMTEDLTPEILKKYKGLTPREAIHKVTGKPYGVKLKELSPEQHEQVLQLLENNPEKTLDASRLLKWFKEDFLINQINNKWGLIPPAIGIGAGIQSQNKNKKK